jgi:hypothetical protein
MSTLFLAVFFDPAKTEMTKIRMTQIINEGGRSVPGFMEHFSKRCSGTQVGKNL